MTNILMNLRLVEKLRAIYDQLAINDVLTIWINKDARKLLNKIRQRQDVVMILEVAKTTFI